MADARPASGSTATKKNGRVHRPFFLEEVRRLRLARAPDHTHHDERKAQQRCGVRLRHELTRPTGGRDAARPGRRHWQRRIALSQSSKLLARTLGAECQRESRGVDSVALNRAERREGQEIDAPAAAAAQRRAIDRAERLYEEVEPVVAVRELRPSTADHEVEREIARIWDTRWTECTAARANGFRRQWIIIDDVELRDDVRRIVERAKTIGKGNAAGDRRRLCREGDRSGDQRQRS